MPDQVEFSVGESIQCLTLTLKFLHAVLAEQPLSGLVRCTDLLGGLCF
jgi:hypothetical protein